MPLNILKVFNYNPLKRVNPTLGSLDEVKISISTGREFKTLLSQIKQIDKMLSRKK
jgi:hypothetical protein